MGVTVVAQVASEDVLDRRLLGFVPFLGWLILIGEFQRLLLSGR